MQLSRRIRSLAAFAATLALTAAAFLAPATAGFTDLGLDPLETASTSTQRVVMVLPRHSAPPKGDHGTSPSLFPR